MIRLLSHYISSRRLVLFCSESLVIFLCLQGLLLSLYGIIPSAYNLHHVVPLVLSVLIYELFFYWFDLYGYQSVHRDNQSMLRLGLALLFATLIVTPLYTLAARLPFHPGMLLNYFILIGAVVGIRWVLPAFLDRTRRLEHTILVLGSHAQASSLAREIQMNAGCGIHVAGFIWPDAPGSRNGNGYGNGRGHGRAHGRRSAGNRRVSTVPSLENVEGVLRHEPTDTPGASGRSDLRLPAVGTLADLDQVVRRERVNTIVVCGHEGPSQLPLVSLLRLKTQGVHVVDDLSFYEHYKGQIPIDDPWLDWMVFSDGCHAPRFTLAVKRLIDIGLSFLALLLAWPLVLVIALLIKLDSQGPALFSQLRPGLGGKLFRVYKFRSMYTDAEPDRLVMDGDRRITRVGRFLRRTRLDELPQLFNVLRGDMSLVGPRPEVLSIAQRLEKEIPYYSIRQSVKPGITGWAQIRYGYCASLAEMQEKFKYDLFYIKNLSLTLDFLIMLGTIKVLIVGKGVR